MKKRVISLVLAGLMLLTLSACGGGDSAPAQSGSSGNAEGASKLSIILKTTASEHWQLMMAGCRKFESEHPDVSISITGPASETSYDDQQNMIETTLNNSDIDAIIIAPLQSETAATLIAGETRPVFALDTNIEAPEIVSFIGTGNEAAAKLGATEAVKAAKAAGWGTIECIEIAGVKGDATNEARMNGYIAGINENGGKFLEDEIQYANAVADQAVTCMEAVMQTHPDGIAVVCANNDDMAVGAVRAAEGNASFSNTIFLGFDGSTGACQAILDGLLTMSIAQQPYEMGYLACQTAYDKLQGKEVDAVVDPGIEVITSENAQARIDLMNEYLA